MKYPITQKLSLALGLLLPIVSSAAPFCVGNSTELPLTWNLTSAKGKSKVFTLPEHSKSNVWKCVNLKDDTYTAEISTQLTKYEGDSCVISIKAKQWVKVDSTNSKDGPTLACQHFSEDGTVLNDVKMAIAGASKGWNLEGSAMVDFELQGATVSVYDSAHKLLGSKTNATSAEGYFSIPLKSPKLVGGRIEITGGKTKTGAFTGRIIKLIPTRFDVQNDFARVNPLTTLASRYLEARPNQSPEAVERQVLKFINLPEDTGLGGLVENPRLRIFSMKTFSDEARKSGGLDQFTKDLSTEMTNDLNVRTFPSRNLMAVQDMIVKGVIEGIAKQVASQMFQSILNGLGFRTDNDMYNLLQDVKARLVEIKQQLNAIEIAVTEGQYGVKAQGIWDKYVAITTALDSIDSWNKKALANMENGQVKDKAKAAEIAGFAQEITKSLTDEQSPTNLLKFIALVNSNFVNPGDFKPMPQLFAELNAMKNRVIRKSYFTEIDGNLFQYQLYQLYAMAVYADIRRATSKDAGDIAVESSLRLINPMKVVLPKVGPFFTSPEWVESVSQGRSAYDSITKRVWYTKYMTAGDCFGMNRYASEDKNGWRPGDNGEIFALLDHLDVPARWNWGDMAMKIGFSMADASRVKMITTSCVIENGRDEWDRDNSKIWFGNDQLGPINSYQDRMKDFYNVARSKNFTSAPNFMLYKQL